MAEGRKYEVGYRKPPRTTRFKPGASGNPKGRPKGAKNFATVIAQELNGRLSVTENGRRKKISKREVIVKRVVNKAAEGDLKAAQTVFAQARLHEDAPLGGGDPAVFDTPEHHLVMAEIVRRIRSMDEVPKLPSTTDATGNSPEVIPETKQEEGS